MKTVLVTGATGFLGRQLALRLAADGFRVHALYRTEARLVGMEHENIIPFRGNLGDPQSISHAMKGCRQVYHVAAFASTWTKDPGMIYEQNVRGTETLLEAAMSQGIEKFLYTSTAAVLGPSDGGPLTEERNYEGRHFTHYDRSKAMAEKRVMDFASGGLPAVVVNPTRIYGPGYRGRSNAVTMMIERYLEGKWRIIPGDGNSMGNYVYVEDVVDCHILAMERGKSGERYISGGENLSFRELFEIIAGESGIHYRMFHLPFPVMMGIAGLMQAGAWSASRFGQGRWTPPIIPSFVRRYNYNWILSSEKACRELGYQPMDFRSGLKKTMEWLEKT